MVSIWRSRAAKIRYCTSSGVRPVADASSRKRRALSWKMRTLPRSRISARTADDALLRRDIALLDLLDSGQADEAVEVREGDELVPEFGGVAHAAQRRHRPHQRVCGGEEARDRIDDELVAKRLDPRQ